MFEWYQAIHKSDLSVFEEEELKTIDLISNLFKNIPSWELVDLSHKERAWVELKENREVVSYQEYGFDIEAV